MAYDPLCFHPASSGALSIRWLPNVAIAGCSTSILDLNGSAVSYHVDGTSDIVVKQWTFGLEDPQEFRNKGVVMICQELSVRSHLSELVQC